MGLSFKPADTYELNYKAKLDGKLCRMGDICDHSIKGLCKNLLNCKDFYSKVKSKGERAGNVDNNDNRLDY